MVGLLLSGPGGTMYYSLESTLLVDRWREVDVMLITDLSRGFVGWLVGLRLCR